MNPDTLKEDFKHYVDGIPNNNGFFERLFKLKTLKEFEKFKEYFIKRYILSFNVPARLVITKVATIMAVGS
jgi:hypothetical protein